MSKYEHVAGAIRDSHRNAFVYNKLEHLVMLELKNSQYFFRLVGIDSRSAIQECVNDILFRLMELIPNFLKPAMLDRDRGIDKFEFVEKFGFEDMTDRIAQKISSMYDSVLFSSEEVKYKAVHLICSLALRNLLVGEAIEL